MKIGQLVMLVKSEFFPGINEFPWPPIGSCGEVIGMCSGDPHVVFPHHPFPDASQGDWWHIPLPWVIPIDDHDGQIAKEDSLDLSDKDLVKMGRKMLKELADAKD